MALQWFTVYGYWAGTGERFAEKYEALDARTAEHMAQMENSGTGDVLRVARVVAGQVPSVDMYTLFVDPQDPRNEQADGLELDTPDFTRGLDPDWTVVGIAVPEGTPEDRVPVAGERYMDVVSAPSAGAAEDVARSRLADKGGALLVCAVLEGAVRAADVYATFVDPDVEPARGKLPEGEGSLMAGGASWTRAAKVPRETTMPPPRCPHRQRLRGTETKRTGTD